MLAEQCINYIMLNAYCLMTTAHYLLFNIACGVYYQLYRTIIKRNISKIMTYSTVIGKQLVVVS